MSDRHAVDAPVHDAPDAHGCPERRWDGEVDLAEGEVVRWSIGPLRLWLQRRRLEWRVAWRAGTDPLDPSLEVAVPCPELDDVPEDDVSRTRFTSRNFGPLSIRPRLPDRAVVARPRIPFHVLAGEEIGVYVAMPLWLELWSGETVLFSTPVVRASDTWFGPDTRRGRPGYASFTAARLYLENMLLRPSLAITEVDVHNRGDAHLLIERLAIPAPELALWADRRNCLWTQAVRVRTEGDVGADVRFADGPPAEARGAVRVAEPRAEQSRSALRRAISAILG